MTEGHRQVEVDGEIAVILYLPYSSPPVCIARSFSAISSFAIAAPISGCSPIFSCKAFKIWRASGPKSTATPSSCRIPSKNASPSYATK